MTYMQRLLNVLLLTGAAGAAHADYTASFSSGSLTIQIADGGNVSVGANKDGILLVNEDAPPDLKLPASEITRIIVYGDEGKNEIDLTGVKADSFPNVLTCSVSASGGDDSVTGGWTTNFLTGGKGEDKLVGGESYDLFVWYPDDGKDVIDGLGNNHDRVDIRAGSEKIDILVEESNGRFVFTVDGSFTSNELENIGAVSITGSDGDDTVTIGDLGGIAIFDGVILNTSGGNDFYDASASQRGIQLQSYQRGGMDVVIGSSANDHAHYHFNEPEHVEVVMERRDGRDAVNYSEPGSRSAISFTDFETIRLEGTGTGPVTMSVYDLSGTDIESLILDGANSDDRFFVMASDSVQMTLGDDSSTDADVLRVDARGGAVTEGPGNIDIAGFNSITHSNIENVEYADQPFVTGDRMAIE